MSVGLMGQTVLLVSEYVVMVVRLVVLRGYVYLFNRTKLSNVLFFSIYDPNNIEPDSLPNLELVSKELNHFGVIAGLFRQIGGHSSRFVLFCSF